VGKAYWVIMVVDSSFVAVVDVAAAVTAKF
jgi:hypothetical protein